MKRLICLLTALMLLCAFALAEDETASHIRSWDAKAGYVYVTLGQYEQTADSEMKPIIWRVLSTDGSTARLLSEYVLFAHCMHSNYRQYEKEFKGDFAQTELALLLNGEFADHAFTEAELNALVPHETYGRIYLLTAADLKDKSLGFVSNESRKGWATEYAIEVTGAFVYQRKMGKHSPYWVMDQSTTNKQGARCTKQEGDIGYINVITLNEGARPTCVVDLSRVQILGGQGTLEEPYALGANEP